MIAAFRMYNATPGAARAWHALFTRAFADVGADIPIVEHRWPEPIDALWARPDLACAFMCGWPFARSGQMHALAAPVPSPARYAGLPRYLSEFLVRASSGWTTLEETFGHRIGWMAGNSQSGFNGPRAHLARFVAPGRGRLYAESRGPLGTPARALEALAGGEVDVVALDGYFLDLCRHHEPARLAGLCCVATTDWSPIPLLVASPGVDAELAKRLRAHLLSLHAQPAYGPLLADVLLARFAAPDIRAYDALEAMAGDAVARGYDAIR